MKQARTIEGLRAAIDERQLSYRQLARLADCSHHIPGRLLEGKAIRDGAAAVRIARVLQRPLDELFVAAVSSDRQRDDDREAVA